MTELTKREVIAKELANARWGYIRQMLAHDQLIERIGFRYKTAFEHGFNHTDQILMGHKDSPERF